MYNVYLYNAKTYGGLQLDLYFAYENTDQFRDIKENKSQFRSIKENTDQFRDIKED